MVAGFCANCGAPNEIGEAADAALRQMAATFGS
jgi:hypothetical protein